MSDSLDLFAASIQREGDGMLSVGGHGGNGSCGFGLIIMLVLPLGYERVHLPLYKVADTPFHIQGDELCSNLCHSMDSLYIDNSECRVTIDNYNKQKSNSLFMLL